MSGFTRDPRYYGDQVVFELTSTKGNYWHEPHNRCRCWTLMDMATKHLLPLGFEVVREGGGFIALIGPGITDDPAEQRTKYMFAGLRGIEYDEADDR